MTWVTGAQASDITGQTVTDGQVAAAHPIIEIFSNITTDASGSLKPRDLRMLRYAEAYQAYWMTTQVDILSRLDVTNVSQDGVTYGKPADNPETFILAPLAKRSLDRLSWRRTRSLHPLTPEQAAKLRGLRLPGTLAGTEEWLDDEQTWKRL